MTSILLWMSHLNALVINPKFHPPDIELAQPAELVKVEHLPIRCCYTDEWGTYHRLFPQQYLHEVNRDQAWRIERRHLNFRTHLKRLSRRTLCFSKNEQIHDNVIGLYIERYYYRHGQFGRAGAAHQRE